jgi:alpha-D-xyloside xylohydrolase
MSIFSGFLASRSARFLRLFSVLLAFACWYPPRIAAQWNPLNPVQSLQRNADGATLFLEHGALRFQVCNASMVRVLYSPQRDFPAVAEYVVIKTDWPKTNFDVSENEKEITLTTAKLKVVVSKKDSSIVFYDAGGKKLAAENDRSMTPVEVNGEKTYHLERFTNMWDTQEAFYGLGQHQAGVFNWRGESVDIVQDNTNISIPLLLSGNGYGVFWNNPSRSRFNNRFVHALYISSEVAEQMDYYFIYGPDFDKIIAAYRDLTGAAPLFGKWAYGYWQCKNRYASQDELLSIAKRYRSEHIPLDNIVQDWFWWNTMGEPVWNKNYPDPKGMVDELHRENVHLMVSVWPYFRPGSAVYDDMAAKGLFIDKTKVGAFHPAGMALYDAFNPDARKYYWDLIDGALFKIGVDAWWLDTTEPETEGREESVLLRNKVRMDGKPASGARYANLFPLMTTAAVYHGQRAASDQKRVFILSRSAFAGAQRHAAAVWSGDVNPNWETFRRQLPAGLNYSLAGNPYWTTDIGGFTAANPDDAAYRELYARWFEFAAFCPIFRAHGTRSTNQNEIWSYGPEIQKILALYDQLRYRLMPYIYSVAWKTTNEGYTPMRALVMDFRDDPRTWNIGDQFLFGPSLLVNPVSEPGATTRHLYLPKGKWYSFWTGESIEGGRSIDAPAPLDQMPLFVRAGSIIPMDPNIEYAEQPSTGAMELRVYAGGDADFTLYQDDGSTYKYEKGERATIAIHWDNAKGKLTIGDRVGQYPGMPTKQLIRVVYVDRNHGVATAESSASSGEVISYDGRAKEVFMVVEKSSDAHATSQRTVVRFRGF